MNLESVMSLFYRVPGVIPVAPMTKATFGTFRKEARRLVVLSRLRENHNIKQTNFITMCKDIGKVSTIRKDISEMTIKGLIVVTGTIDSGHFLVAC